MFLQAGNFYGYEEYFGRNTSEFKESREFANQFSRDVRMLLSVSGETIKSIDEQFDSQYEDTVSQVVNEYLTYKAEIIRNELEYAVNNYDDSYFNYEYTADLVPPPTTSAPATEPCSEPTTVKHHNESDIPRNIETAKKALETSVGLDILRYDVLVRDDAFNVSFSSDIYVTLYDASGNEFEHHSQLYASNIHYNEEQIKNEFSAQYNRFKSDIKSDYSDQYYTYESELDNRYNLKYYIVSDNNHVISNTDAKPTSDYVKMQLMHITGADGKINLDGVTSEKARKLILQSGINTNATEFYIYLEDTKYDDIYSDMYNFHMLYNRLTSVNLILIFIISLTIAVICLILLLKNCGIKYGEDAPVKAKIDRIPVDIHLILTSVIITFGIFSALSLLSYSVWDAFKPYTTALLCYSAVAGIISAIWMLFIEWMSSLLRIKKVDNKITSNMFLIKAASFTSKKSKAAKDRILKEFTYKPMSMQKRTIAFIIGYVLINLSVMILGILFNFLLMGEFVTLMCIIALVIFNTLTIIFLMKYTRLFDILINAAKDNRNIDLGNEKVPAELKTLADNLSVSNQKLNEAIAKAVRDEHMKTELITNVSHDLKTPLTSLISYSDLLTKCNIGDENAIKYIQVIHQQSIKLKRLIEDLIEASKVSSGNVALDKSVLNLSELAIQAIVEFSPETEKNGNEIKFEQPEVAPQIFADGAKTYRIIANLLNNAKKYSAPNTRIYVSVYSDGINGYFEIKNISCEPLNISPDELTERFVRGDKSRSREGNGLGLSIAKDLCTIQNGELKIIIDGDLFKAIVKLPCKQNSEESENNTTNE